jgi:hypothetical protein
MMRPGVRVFGLRRVAAFMLLVAVVPIIAPPGHLGATSTFAVNTMIDAHDARATDGACDIGDGTCSLRAAVEQANFDGVDTIPPGGNITVPAGYVIPLSLGRIQIKGEVTLSVDGVGAAPIIDGSLNPSTSPGVLGIACDNVHPITVSVTGFTFRGGSDDGISIGGTCTTALLADLLVSGNTTTGNGGGIDIHAGGTSRVTLTNVTASGNTAGRNGGGISIVGTTTVLTNVTIDRNTITDNSIGSNGAGLYNMGGGTVTISNSSITNNRATGTETGTGGIFLFDQANMTIHNGTITGNSSQYGGAGGINNANATLSIDGSTIGDNQTASNGGGLSNGGATTVVDTTIRGNTAGNLGGGVYQQGTLGLYGVTIGGSGSGQGNSAVNGGGGLFANSDSTTTVGATSDCPCGLSGTGRTALTGNHATGTGALGGGIATLGTMTVQSGTTVSGNDAGGGGGGISAIGTLTINRSTISGNSTPANGGGLALAVNRGNRTTATISGSTISGNSASGQGGAIFAAPDYSPTTIAFTTIANNSSGIWRDAVPSEGLFTLANTILADNSVECGGAGHLTSGDYIIERSNTCDFTGAHDWHGSDPHLLPLQSASIDGPPVHPLAPNSPAIDAGGAGCASNLSPDESGNVRPQGNGCDIGAIEYVPVSPAIGDLDPDTAPAGGGVRVTITGGGFQTGTTIRFADSVATVLSVSDDGAQIVVLAPALAPGSVTVTAVNPGNKIGTSSGTFGYVQAAPGPRPPAEPVPPPPHPPGVPAPRPGPVDAGATPVLPTPRG